MSNNRGFREASASQNVSPQTKAEQHNKGQLDFEQNRQINLWCSPSDDERHLQLQSNEANNIYFKCLHRT